MKYFFKTLKEMLIALRKEILLFEGIVLGGYVIGLIISVIIAECSGDQTFVNMGSFFAFIALAIVIFFGSVFSCSQEFVLAISCGKNRTNFVFGRYLIYLLQFGLGIAVVYFGNMFEKFIGSLKYVETDFIGLPLPASMFAVILFALPAIVMLLAGLYVKFERKAFWVIWVLWMVLALGAPRVATAMQKNPESVSAKIGFFIKDALTMGSTQSMIVIAVAGVAAMVANHFMYKYLEAKL